MVKTSVLKHSPLCGGQEASRVPLPLRSGPSPSLMYPRPPLPAPAERPRRAPVYVHGGDAWCTYTVTGQSGRVGLHAAPVIPLPPYRDMAMGRQRPTPLRTM